LKADKTHCFDLVDKIISSI